MGLGELIWMFVKVGEFDALLYVAGEFDGLKYYVMVVDVFCSFYDMILNNMGIDNMMK